MRLPYIALAILALSAASCVRDDNNSRDRQQPAAREAGREAYRASQEVKEGAKKAAQELRNAGQEFRQGWGEAKHNQPATTTAPATPPPPPPPPARRHRQ